MIKSLVHLSDTLLIHSFSNHPTAMCGMGFALLVKDGFGEYFGGWDLDLK
jgi:hypothetical protein